MKNLPVCDIVIVNWNAGPLLGQCIASLAGASRTRFTFGSIVVVDNASTDGSADFAKPLGLPVMVLRNEGNEGFARACNRGASKCSGTHLLFLNPDTVVPTDCLDGLFSWLARNPDHAHSIVGIRLVDSAGRTSVTCSRFPDLRSVIAKTMGLERSLARFGWSQPMYEFDHRHTRVVDQVIGAFFLVPRRVFDALQGFAEAYYLYYEEVDFCRRAQRLGHRSVFCADVSAIHIGGGSSSKVPVKRLLLNLRSRLIYYRANFSWPSYAAAAFLTLAIEPLTRIAHECISRRFAAAGYTILAYRALYRELVGGAGTTPR